MNKTKKILIILAAVFAILEIGWNIYDIVMFFMAKPIDRQPIFYLIYDFILMGVNITIATLLILSIWKNGSLFRARYGMYMTALVLSIIFSTLSITSILLIVTMFISDWVWIKPKNEEKYHKEDIVFESKEDKIARLRDMKERGELTEEQFQEELMKLL
ncbi:MAG: SHOCT domain-containing protein [Clostridia bacterium]|nr:SHOCT domain-containing protein [Clostridia bacterium]